MHKIKKIALVSLAAILILVIAVIGGIVESGGFSLVSAEMRALAAVPTAVPSGMPVAPTGMPVAPALDTAGGPAYIKDTYAAKEGDSGFTAYFILADEGGTQVPSDGTLYISVKDSNGYEYAYPQTPFPVSGTDFQEVTLGQGAFAHRGLIYDTGRIRYTSLRSDPTQSGDTFIALTVKFTFVTPQGVRMTGSDTFYP